MSEIILAVSGGVDSMVMLDMFKNSDAIVAHFDHGTRDSAADDAIFVCKKVTNYEKIFKTECGKLGQNTSEEVARKARYEFLRGVSAENDGVEIYTAHHLDDLLETVAINLIRGTGWRGLAVLDSPGIRRPFLEPELLSYTEPLDKERIFRYAAEEEVAFREDPTNSSDEYLRNRIRHQMHNSNAKKFTFAEKLEIYELWQKQKRIRHQIDEIIEQILPLESDPWKREWFRGLNDNELDQKIAIELLRAGTLRVGIYATRPQLEDFRQAIIGYAPGKSFNLPKNRLIKFTKNQFWL